MTRTSAVNFESDVVCQEGRLAENRLVCSSQLKKTLCLITALILSLLMISVAGTDLQAQTPVPAYVDLNADQLDQLVAPIALDPDPLVAQILTSSTYPDQVAAADSWSNQNIALPTDQRAAGADGMPWDPAVKGLIEFPALLDNLAKNVAWTAQLGNAYYNQPDDVMNAIQALRSQAQQSSILVTTPQERVVVAAGVIDILPVDPAVVYVPYYNPWRIWGTLFVSYPGYVVEPPPVGVVAVAGLAFEPPVAVAAYAGYDWGFSAWTPAWTGGAVLFNQSAYISNSVTVANHGFFGGHDRGVFEHDGHGVPKGYHACAHSGAARETAVRARTQTRSSYSSKTSVHSQTRNSYSSKTSVHSQTRNSYSPKTNSRSQGRNSYSSKMGNHSQAHNASRSGMNHSQARNASRSGMNHSQARNTNRSGMNHSQARNTSRSGMNHSQARNTNRSSMNHSQARNSNRSGMNHSQARNSNRSGMNHSQARNSNRSGMNHSQARNTNRSGMNHSQARNTNRSSGMNRSQARAPHSSGAGNRPSPKTVANRQSSGGHSGGSKAAGGKRR